MPGGKFSVNILLTLVVGAVITWLIHSHPPAAWNAMQWVGAGLLCVGFVLWSVARFQLGASLTVSAQARKLVTRGLYAKIRNPIYVFGSCTLVGLILTLGRPVWLLIFLAIIPLQIWRASKECSVLDSAFGDEYRSYRAKTWF
ncbi:MAG: methyltransferase family protein [Bdellovibrionota bacterium]|jgi:protein-S-isoprenylcysteine O-methyltransferase Ste14